MVGFYIKDEPVTVIHAKDCSFLMQGKALVLTCTRAYFEALLNTQAKEEEKCQTLEQKAISLVSRLFG